jgi:hypothetical protein
MGYKIKILYLNYQFDIIYRGITYNYIYLFDLYLIYIGYIYILLYFCKIYY